jgi:hypothetical protein
VLDFAEAGQARRRPLLGPEPASPGDVPAGEDAWRAALGAVTEWAWTTAMSPLLHEVRQRRHDREAGTLPRVVLVPGGILGIVPWHAAWTATSGGEAGQGRTYACQHAIFTYAVSGRQFADSACRTPLHPGSDAVFVADPTHSLPGAVFQTRALREHLYPRALGYGWTGEPGEDAGTPSQVLRHLPGPGSPGASLLQFSCHGVSLDTPMTSYLDLASPSPPAAPECDATAGKLHVRQILRRAYSRRDLSAPGGLVVLAACVSDITPSDYDEALTLSTAFLAAGAVSVVGSRWEISDRVTPALMFMFHYFLRRESMAAADALQATQEWMLDPDRAVPPEMDPVIRDAFRTHDCTDIAAWAAFIHQGR